VLVLVIILLCNQLIDCVCVCDKGTDSVITDVIIQNEKDVPPPGYMLIERTLDSSELSRLLFAFLSFCISRY